MMPGGAFKARRRARRVLVAPDCATLAAQAAAGTGESSHKATSTTGLPCLALKTSSTAHSAARSAVNLPRRRPTRTRSAAAGPRGVSVKAWDALAAVRRLGARELPRCA